MYFSVGNNYEDHLVAIVNVLFFITKLKNIISSVFSTLSQAQSRVSAQSIIVSVYNNDPSVKTRMKSVFKDGIIV